jgi:hypothetical protein
VGEEEVVERATEEEVGRATRAESARASKGKERKGKVSLGSRDFFLKHFFFFKTRRFAAARRESLDALGFAGLR